MNNPLRKILRTLPEGYIKSIAKNISSFTMNRMPHKIDIITMDGEKILIYTDNVFANEQLANEVRGYTTYYALKKGDFVIDAGAYTGLFTLYASKKVGQKGKVIAFEPDPYNYIMLQRNLKLNKVKNVIVVKKGLFSKDDTVPFDIQSIGSNIVSINHAFHNRKTINKITVTALDDELDRLHIKKVDFVKMDIEGAEIEAMEGLKRTIKANKNIHFAIASYHIVNGKKTKFFLEKFFKQLKFHVKTEDHGQLTTYASR